MPRQLKFYNGSIPTMERYHGYIAAFTKKQAVELGLMAFGSFSSTELNNYWSDTWGNAMSTIQPKVTEPGVWLVEIRPPYHRIWKLVEAPSEDGARVNLEGFSS